MKASEISQKLKDLLDEATSVKRINDQETQPVFLPPLQVKIELLKKSMGMDNAFDQKDSNEPDVDRIKKLSGIAIRDEASNDEPLDI
jgi:hypothetical protein